MEPREARKEKKQSNERHHVGCDQTPTHPSPCESLAKKKQDTYTETETSVHKKKSSVMITSKHQLLPLKFFAEVCTDFRVFSF